MRDAAWSGSLDPMRVLVAALALAACAPAVSTKFEHEDFAPDGATAVPVEPVAENRPVAPPKGERTGTIDRAHLIAVLDQGPGMFLRQVEVTASMRGDRFVGWQLVQFLGGAGPLSGVDLAPGDVLLAVNGQAISRPDQLQTLWDGLRTANEVTAQLWRGDGKFELTYQIEPKVELAK